MREHTSPALTGMAQGTRQEPHDVLSTDAVRRLLLSLIDRAQSGLIKKGTVSANCALARLTFELTEDEIDRLTIDESTLGFDSLSRLDLVLSVNQFFNLHLSGVEDYLLVKHSIGEWVELVMHHNALTAENLAISFQTSGSTGVPKHVTHNAETLLAEVAALLDTALSGWDAGGRIIALLPPCHIYGFLFTCLLPSRLSIETLDLHQHSPTSVFSKSKPGDLVIATPFIWHRLAKTERHFQPGIHGITSSAPSSAETWLVPGKTGLSTLTEIYGATETGGIGHRRAPEQDFALLPNLRRDGTQVLRADVRSSQLDIQDHLIWTSATSFKVAGRKDCIVQIAGTNVSPNLVARTIEEVAGVKAAHVRHDGERLKALVVTTIDNQDLAAVGNNIRHHLSAKLNPVARPSEITFCTSLPQNEMGKVIDLT